MPKMSRPTSCPLNIRCEVERGPFESQAESEAEPKTEPQAELPQSCVARASEGELGARDSRKQQSVSKHKAQRCTKDHKYTPGRTLCSNATTRPLRHCLSEPSASDTWRRPCLMKLPPEVGGSFAQRVEQPALDPSLLGP